MYSLLRDTLEWGKELIVWMSLMVLLLFGLTDLMTALHLTVYPMPGFTQDMVHFAWYVHVVLAAVELAAFRHLQERFMEDGDRDE